MSVVMNDSIKYRLIEHMVWTCTCNQSETLEKPHLDGAKNFYLGTLTELSNLVSFTTPKDIEKAFFNEEGDPIRYPGYTGNLHLVACIKDHSREISIINVFGVYTIAGMKDIVVRNDKNNIEWKLIEIPNKIKNELIEKIETIRKGNTVFIPTRNFDQLSEDEKLLKKYDNWSIQKVPLEKAWCSVS